MNLHTALTRKAAEALEGGEAFCRVANKAEVVHDGTCGKGGETGEAGGVDRLKKAGAEKPSKTVALATAVGRQKRVYNDTAVTDHKGRGGGVCEAHHPGRPRAESPALP